MSGSMHRLSTGYVGNTGLPPSMVSRTRSRDRLRLLAEAIEAEIVPRLVAGYVPDQTPNDGAPEGSQAGLWEGPAPQVLPNGHRPASALPGDSAHHSAPDLMLCPIPQAAMDLAAMVLSADEGEGRSYVTEAVARLGLEPACLDLLAPAARHLGNLWDQDICTFTDVTIGLMRLQSALLSVTVPAVETAAMPSPRRTALVAPAPGDQHTFGLTMVSGSLERAGWTVIQVRDGAPEAIEAALRTRWYGVLGVSIGSEARLRGLPKTLQRMRAMSRNPDLAILVGGPVFAVRPELAAEVGADATAADGPHAVDVAEALVVARKSPRMATG